MGSVLYYAKRFFVSDAEAPVVERRQSQSDATPADSQEEFEHELEIKRIREQFSYPPQEKGIPFESPEALVETHANLIQQLRTFVSMGPRFDNLYYDVIVRYARLVHLLPASQSNHHRLMGGLLHHGIQTSVFAYRFAEAVEFDIPDRLATVRKKELSDRYRYASFLAALCHDIGKVVSDLQVHDRDGTNRWNPYQESLCDWSERLNIQRYFITWLPGRHHRHIRFNQTMFNLVVTPEAMAYLGEFGPEIQADLIASISGQRGSEVAKISSFADSKSTEEDLANQSVVVGQMAVGISLAEKVVQKMTNLIRDNEISTRVSDMYVINVDDEIYLQWPYIAERVIEALKKDRVPGIPSDPKDIADTLVNHGYAHKHPNGLYYYLSKKKKGAVREYMMLKAPEIEKVFPSSPPPPLAIDVVVHDLPAKARKLDASLNSDPEAIKDVVSISEEAAPVNDEEQAQQPNEQSAPNEPSPAPKPQTPAKPQQQQTTAQKPKPQRSNLASKMKSFSKHGEAGQLIIAAGAYAVRNRLPYIKQDNGEILLRVDAIIEATGFDHASAKDTLVASQGLIKLNVDGVPESVVYVSPKDKKKYVRLADGVTDEFRQRFINVDGASAPQSNTAPVEESQPSAPKTPDTSAPTETAGSPESSNGRQAPQAEAPAPSPAPETKSKGYVDPSDDPCDGYSEIATFLYRSTSGAPPIIPKSGHFLVELDEAIRIARSQLGPSAKSKLISDAKSIYTVDGKKILRFEPSEKN